VFRSEPEYDLRFQHLPNVFMTPHMGTATVETRAAMGNRALDNVMDALAGHTPRDAL
jgi:hydroxypyruvate reductase